MCHIIISFAYFVKFVKPVKRKDTEINFYILNFYIVLY